ncbi:MULTISPECIES: YdgA family protein [unclassified Hahella]|uniref:YdgA family protein n=1 Tax=unclassified Hahella TaxID=2624107 RepID=UPI001C1EA61A|nr:MULTISPECIES: YdgA family protein [unclassified Hahella]MBU6954761.1 YdgA family protein [Hahella sp. HN01]MDG9671313.1 YdgA family protein [Hahella sp. CR1]
MKKIWLAAPIAVAVAAAPFVIAHKAEQNFDAGVQDVSSYLAFNGLPVELTVQKYEKGFLSSKAINRLQLSPEFQSMMGTGGDQPVCLDLVTEIKHDYMTLLKGGLLTATTRVMPLQNQADCGLAEVFTSEKELADFYTQQFGEEGPFTIESAFKIDGSNTITFSSKPINVDKEEEGKSIKINVTPMQGVIGVSPARDHVVANINWQGLNVAAHNGEKVGDVKVGSYTLKMEANQILEHLWAGSSEQVISDIKIGSEDGQNFSVSTITLKGKDTIAENLLSSAAFINVNDMLYDGMDVGSMALNLSFNNFETEATNRLVGVIKQINTQATASTDPDQFLTELENQKDIIVGDLITLAKKADIKIDKWELKLGENSFNANADLRMDGVDQLSADVLKEQPQVLMANVLLNAEGKLDEALVSSYADVMVAAQSKTMELTDEDKAQMKEMLLMQFSNMAQMYVQMGLLNYDEASSQYSAKVGFAKGGLTVNGQPFNPNGG